MASWARAANPVALETTPTPDNTEPVARLGLCLHWVQFWFEFQFQFHLLDDKRRRFGVCVFAARPFDVCSQAVRFELASA